MLRLRTNLESQGSLGTRFRTDFAQDICQGDQANGLDAVVHHIQAMQLVQRQQPQHICSTHEATHETMVAMWLHITRSSHGGDRHIRACHGRLIVPQRGLQTVSGSSSRSGYL